MKFIYTDLKIINYDNEIKTYDGKVTPTISHSNSRSSNSSNSSSSIDYIFFPQEESIER
jgi:hypothetical protein